MSSETENKDNQKMMDEMIENFYEKGMLGHAKSAVSLGGASKSVVEKAILPCLETEIKELKDTRENDPCGIYNKQLKVSDTIRLLEEYGIKPVGMIDEAVDHLLKTKQYYFALSFAEKGSEEAKEKAIKASLQEEEGKSVFSWMDTGNNKQERKALVLKILKNS